MARKQHDPPIPPGLKVKGAATWVRLTDAYEFEAAPERLLILEELCRCVDMVDRLQSIIDNADDLRVRGSQGQPVSLPEIAECRQWRAQITSLTRALSLPADDAEDEPKVFLTMSELGKRGAAARWKNKAV